MMKERFNWKGFHEVSDGETKIIVNGKEVTGTWLSGFLFKKEENFFIDAKELLEETISQYVDTIEKTAVYENDVIKSYKYGDKEEVLIEPVVWRHGTWWVGNWSWIEFKNKFRCVEIIGNVFDKRNYDFGKIQP